MDTTLRNVTQGEPWVDDVIDCTKTFLPAAVAAVNVDVPDSEEVKKAKQAIREKGAARIEGGYRPEDDTPGERGGGYRSGRDKDAFASFNGRSGGRGRTCYNCGEEGHQVLTYVVKFTFCWNIHCCEQLTISTTSLSTYTST